MPFSGAVNGQLLAPAIAASSFGGALLVGALLIRFSGPGAVRLRFWGIAWIALAVRVAGAAIALATAETESPIVYFAGVLAFCAGTYAFLLGLLFGASDLPEQRPLSASSTRILSAIAATFAVMTLLSFYFEPRAPLVTTLLHRSQPLVIRVIVCATVACRLAADRPRFASGRGLVFLSMVLQCGEALSHLTMRAGDPSAAVAGSLARVVIFGLMGMGMIACLLDDDHQAIARASAEARRASDIDPLTALSNKAAFVREASVRLSDVLHDRRAFGIVFLALNRLGAVNHSLGHTIGDRVLRASAERLRASLRDGDQVGRVSGDEFAVLVADVSERDDVLSVANKLQEVMRRPFEIDGRELSVNASVGVSLYPHDAVDAETLLDQACTAAHRVKDRVSGRVGVYSKGMNADALERLALEHDLRHAIERDELVLYFQPVFRLPAATVSGFEALIRWRHPRFGLIGADVIVPLAESTGLIHTVGPWALRAACARIEALRRSGREMLFLNVNVSAHQLMTSDLTDHVQDALRASALPASHLEIEVTETTAIDNIQTARDHLLVIKKMGVSIAIDDFGTGYSSLSYLRNLPLDTIKIDRSFIRDVGVDLADGALVTTIIALAQGRDLRVVAEGVETDEQLRFLVSRGCDYAQGYLLSRPLPPESLDDFGSFPQPGPEDTWARG